MPTERAEYDFFVYPIGQLASKNILSLLSETNQEDPEGTWEKLELADGTKLRVQPITERQMNTIYRSKRGDYKLRVDYELYRRNRSNGKVTPVPVTVFEVTRPTQVVKKAVHPKKKAATLRRAMT